MRKGMMLFATLCSLRLTPSRIIGGLEAVVKAISAMNIHKENFFEQKDKRAKQRKYSLTKTVTVAGDDIDLRQNKLRSLHISKSTKYKYRRSALYLKRVNKKSRIRNRYTTVYEEGPGGKGDGGNPPIISTDIKE